VGAYIKAVRPDVKIIGVQMSDSNAMAQSVAAGARRSSGSWCSRR